MKWLSELEGERERRKEKTESRGDKRKGERGKKGKEKKNEEEIRPQRGSNPRPSIYSQRRLDKHLYVWLTCMCVGKLRIAIIFSAR